MRLLLRAFLVCLTAFACTGWCGAAPIAPSGQASARMQAARLADPPFPTAHAYAGSLGGTLILAGAGGVWTCTPPGTGGDWRKTDALLPADFGAGSSAVGQGAMFCVDGRRVVKLALENGGVRVETAFPALPVPMDQPAVAVLDGHLYVVGASIHRLALPGPGKPAAPYGWEELSAIRPGLSERVPSPPGTRAPVIGVRKDELAYRDALYLFAPGEGGCWRFVPGDGSRNGWIAMPDLPPGITPTSCAPVGPAHLLHTTAEGRLMLYHTYTGRWVEAGTSEVRGRLAATDGPVVWLDEGAWKLEFQYEGKRFGWIDYSVIVLYMAAMIGVGEYFRRKEKTAKDFLLGGQKIPWWAAGLSIWATGVSAISYMAIPAKTYAFDWSYISLGLWPTLTTIFVAYAFIPMLRRLQIVSITEYIELRFDRSLRVPTTVLTILAGVLGRLATVLLLPSMALSAVTGWPVWVSIVSMGTITTIYTVAGGMGAVIWTDVVQTLVMLGGVLLSVLLVVLQVDGGFAGALRVALDHDKLRMFDFSWDFSVATFWVFILWALMDLWGRLGQEGLQRAFSTKDVRSARRAMITCAVVALPATFLFYGIGTGLFAFYSQHPGDLNPNLPTDSIFPLFIMQQMPAGVAGLVIAGIFAAAMSTLSGMNSYATIVVQDFCAYFGNRAPDHKRLSAARWVTLLYGVMATCGALYMSTWKISSVWDTFTKVMALMSGGVGCVMVLGLLTRRSNSFGVWVGIVAGTAVMWGIEIFKLPISFFIYGTIATGAACVTGYLASLATGGCNRDLTGLTLWTLPESDPDKGSSPAGS